MFMSIVHQTQEFYHAHGILPNVLYLNSEHYTQLRKNRPQIFSDDGQPHYIIPLGLKIVIVPSELLQHPEVARVLCGMSQIFHRGDRSVYKKQARAR